MRDWREDETATLRKRRARRAPADSAVAIDAALAAILRGEAVEGDTLYDTEAIMARVDHHGIAGLLFGARGQAGALPAEVVDALHSRAVGHAFWEDLHREKLVEVIGVLHAAGARPLLFKGSALAYSLYDPPFARLRGDSDLIVAPGHFIGACAALEGAGFRAPLPSRGSLVASTIVFAKSDRLGRAHEFDIHQRISNSAALGRLFTFEELHARSEALPALAPEARAVGDLDAFMIACFHRQVHAESPYFVNGLDQHDPDRMIWLADIDRLARRLDEAAWDELAAMCEAKGLASVVHDGLAAARRVFATPLPAAALDRLARQPRDTWPTRYLAASAGERTLLDIAATSGVGRKLRHLAELVFPAPAYVRAMFPNARRMPLPVLYARYIGGRSVKRIASLLR